MASGSARKVQITPEAKQQIEELRYAGSAVPAIVKQTGLSKATVNLGSG